MWSALRSSRTGRRLVGLAAVVFLATCVTVSVAITGTDDPAPRAAVPAAPSEVTLNAALTAFTTANGYFLKVPGILGESQQARHENEIDVRTASWGVTNATGTSTAAVIQDLTVTKLIDRASPLLMKAAAAGTALGTVVLTAEKNASTPTIYATITITGAKVRTFKQTADTTNAFAETVGFSFTSMRLTYLMQNSTGGTTPYTGCWNLATHVAC